MVLRVVADPERPTAGSPVVPTRRLYLEFETPSPGWETALFMPDVSRGKVLETAAAFAALGVEVRYDPPGNMNAGFKWDHQFCCSGMGENRGTAPACCKRAGEYNGYPDERIFTCPRSCPCHD